MQAPAQDRESGRHSEDPSKALESVVRKHAMTAWALYPMVIDDVHVMNLRA